MTGWPKRNSGANRQIGPTQLALLRRLAASRNGQAIIDERSNNAEWCAAKRLERRGLLSKHVFGNPGIGRTVIYSLTEVGRAKLKAVDKLTS